jgi:hypothetical protein
MVVRGLLVVVLVAVAPVVGGLVVVLVVVVPVLVVTGLKEVVTGDAPPLTFISEQPENQKPPY